MRITIVFPIVSALLLSRQSAYADDTGSIPKHLADAENFVKHIKLADTKYAHGEPRVEWKGANQAEKDVCITDCSGFIDALLMHSYGYSREDLKKWLGKSRPTANLYHDAIDEQKGFTHIAHFRDVRSGDILAVKYLTRKDNTGHVMLAAGSPKKMTAKKPLVEGTDQWELSIIDCSESGHGSGDTRHGKGEGGKDHTGLGEGILCVYTNSNGDIAGWTWSTLTASKFEEPKSEHLVVGRLKPGFKP